MSVEEVSEEHYDNFKRALETVPVHNVLIITIDFKALEGRKDVHYSYHEKTNRNDKMLLDLAMEKHLEITNTKQENRKTLNFSWSGRCKKPD